MKQYEITHIADLLQLDDDQLSRCLDELARHMADLRPVYEMAKGFRADLKPSDVLPRTVWIDDNKQDLTINLKIMEAPNGKAEA